MPLGSPVNGSGYAFSHCCPAIPEPPPFPPPPPPSRYDGPPPPPPGLNVLVSPPVILQLLTEKYGHKPQMFSATPLNSVLVTGGRQVPIPKSDRRSRKSVSFGDERPDGNGHLADVHEVQCLKRAFAPELWPPMAFCRGEMAPQEEEEHMTAEEAAANEADSSQLIRNTAANSRAHRLPPVVNDSATEKWDHSASTVSAEWCEHLLNQLNSPDAWNQSTALVQLRGAVGLLASSSLGCSVVQRAFSVCTCAVEQDILAAELRGRVFELTATSSGCGVLQQCLQRVRPAASGFIAEELRKPDVLFQVTRHGEGFRVVCSILEHLPHEWTKSLIKDLMNDAAALCRHARGNHIVQHVLEHGAHAEREQVCRVLAAEFGEFARHRTASHVVEKALQHTNSSSQALLATAALQAPDVLVTLASSRQSQFVVRKLIALPDPHGDMIRNLLGAHVKQLSSSKYGIRTVNALAAWGGA